METNHVLIRVSKPSRAGFLQRQVMFGILFVLLCVNQVGAQTFVDTVEKLQNALTNNQTNIQVKYGEYQLTKTLVVKSGVTITGGYTALNQRGGQGATTLKAKEGQRVITLEGGTVDGFIITGGTDDVAGGVCFQSGGGTLKNCLVTKNTDTDGVGVGVSREGLSAANNIQYCTIANNTKAATDFFKYVTVKNIRWAKGNLKGDGSTGAEIAGPTETGDFAHMASLILYPIQNAGTAAKPSAYSSTTFMNTAFESSPGPSKITGNSAATDNANDGVGDACRYYLKDKWRLPDDKELQVIATFYEAGPPIKKYYTEESLSGNNCILIPADLPDGNLYVRMTGFVNQGGQQEGGGQAKGDLKCSWWWCGNWGSQSGNYGRGLGFGFTGVSIHIIPERIRYDSRDRSIKDGSSFRCVYATDKTN